MGPMVWTRRLRPVWSPAGGAAALGDANEKTKSTEFRRELVDLEDGF
ncbi:hypothetical protein BZL29_7695 [Mycobacterium kansasii]|uniref:Uncharacterized protein n=1 Tax=Mycobacterium kansasii TaxID=1768 RepID=A0A1V3WG63_MYCKA|nr:hypothetical protein BZL29_7695 [Mycobacterium kansasii]